MPINCEPYKTFMNVNTLLNRLTASTENNRKRQEMALPQLEIAQIFHLAQNSTGQSFSR